MPIYGFENLDDFNKTAEVVRHVLRQNGLIGNSSIKDFNSPVYVKCTEAITANGDINKKEGKGVEVEFDFDSWDWVEVETDPMIFDYDQTAQAGNSEATVFNQFNFFNPESELSTDSGDNIYLIAPYKGRDYFKGDYVNSGGTPSSDPEELTTSDWIVIETGGTSGQTIFDCLVTENFDDEPDRYIVEVYTNYYGQYYTDTGGSSGPIAEDKTMLIDGAIGDPLDLGTIMKCQKFIEYHDEPIGEAPEPPDPLPDGYEQPDPPYAVDVYRAINTWLMN